MALRAIAGRNWRSIFESWSAGPKPTEQEKCENAERAVKKAIAASTALAKRDVVVKAQGSYNNRTNVRLDSDVDVRVCLQSTFIPLYAPGVTAADLRHVSATYLQREFKDDVEKALRKYFGDAAVVRGEKAFDIHENTYRLDADVVPVLEYNWYFRRDGEIRRHIGTSLFPDGGNRIINWPEQNYENGVRKNDETKRHFKRVVRILKRLRNEMVEEGVPEAAPIASYLIESLVWNVPNVGFTGDYFDEVRYALIHLFNGTKTDESVKEWFEVNQLKRLFGADQRWTREQVNAFILAAWRYVGFE